MAEICIISMDNINRSPYLNNYINNLNGPIDLIYWDRVGKEEKPEGIDNIYRYTNRIKNKIKENSYEKLKGYIGFRNFAINTLKDKHYKLLILFTQNTGLLIKDFLIKHFSGRYIIDIRDYWKENNKFIFFLEKSLIEHAGLRVISSPAYQSFLPKEKYLVMHNFQPIDWQRNKNDKYIQEPFVLACIGGIKNPNMDCDTIKMFANDNRFVLKYIGRGFGQLIGDVNNYKAGNVIIEDEFPIEETENKYEGVDVILNLYGNHHPHFDYALSNKLYLAAELHTPILVCEDTYMAKLSIKYGFGFELSLDQMSNKESLYKYLSNIDSEKLGVGCDKFINRVKRQNSETFHQIRAFVDSIL